MEPQKNILTLPVAIVVAGIIIGGAIFFSRGGPVPSVFKQPPQQAPADVTADFSLRPIDKSDHLLGNPDAPIVILEYSDLECPFCKSFHKTMQKLMDTYGKDGKIAWVYRHFPLEIHPRSPHESEATECAGELGGNSAFWNYTNRIFEITPSNNGLDIAELPVAAGDIKLNVTQFQTCLDSGKFVARVKADYDDGLKAGVNGTPHSVLILKTDVTAAAETHLAEINQQILLQLPPGTPNVITVEAARRKVGISGAFQYAMMKEILDLLLSGK